MSRRRVALVGASSTGKSTVFELLKNRLQQVNHPGWTFINESTRTVSSYDFPINEEGTNLTQLAISTFHLSALLHPGPILFDRCYMDLVAYTRHLPVASNVRKFIEETWMQVHHQYDLFVYFPIEFNSVEDGVRSINEEWRREIDNEFKVLLQENSYTVLTVSGSPHQRVQQIFNYI